jgi:hypothetical protein
MLDKYTPYPKVTPRYHVINLDQSVSAIEVRMSKRKKVQASEAAQRRLKAAAQQVKDCFWAAALKPGWTRSKEEGHEPKPKKRKYKGYW